MDLSKVPDLELRQKFKPISEQLDAIKRQRGLLREEYQAKLGALAQQSTALEEQVSQLGDREIVGTCRISGLPIFDGDDFVEEQSLAVLHEGEHG